MDKLQLFDTPFNGRSHEKFVQVYVRDEPILAIGSFARKHGSILDEVLRNAGIPFDQTFKCTGGVKHAQLNGEEYRAVGMGFIFDRGNNLYLLRDESLDYLIGPHKSHLDELGDTPGMRFEIR